MRQPPIAPPPAFHEPSLAQHLLGLRRQARTRDAALAHCTHAGRPSQSAVAHPVCQRSPKRGPAPGWFMASSRVQLSEVLPSHEPEQLSHGFKASRDGVCPILERFEFLGIPSGFMAPRRGKLDVEAFHEPRSPKPCESLSHLGRRLVIGGSCSPCGISESSRLPMNLRRSARLWTALPTRRERFGLGSRGGSKAPEDWRAPRRWRADVVSGVQCAIFSL